MLVGIAVVLVVLALVLSYAGRAVLRSQPFADRAVAALRDPAVQDDVADHLTASVVQLGAGDLVTVRPIVRAVAGTVVGSNAFAALFHRAALNAHDAVVGGNGGAIFLNVADASVLIQGALERFAPEAAARVRAQRVATLLTLHPGAALVAIVHAAKRVYAAAWILAVLAAFSAAGALAVSPDRRRTSWLLGIALVGGGLFVVALYIVGGAIAAHVAPEGTSAVARAVWRSFLDGLQGFGQQDGTIAEQLDDGVRGLLIRDSGLGTRASEGSTCATGSASWERSRSRPRSRTSVPSWCPIRARSWS